MTTHTHYLWFETKKRQERLRVRQRPRVRPLAGYPQMAGGDYRAVGSTALQRVFYGEWDGQRRKRVIIKVLGEA